MTDEELRKIAEEAHDHIGNLCTGEDRWTMTVPPRDSDSDMLFTALADGIEELLDRVETAEQALQRVRELHQPRMNSMSALYPEPLCSCQSLYPCATIRALEGDEHSSRCTGRSGKG